VFYSITEVISKKLSCWCDTATYGIATAWVQHEYLLIYSFKLKSAFDTCQLFGCSLCFVAKQYILQQASEEVNRKCPFNPLHWPWEPQYTRSQTDRQTDDSMMPIADDSTDYKIEDIVAERRFRLAGHILRLPHHRHSKTAVRWTPAGGTRSSKENMEKDIARRLGRVHLTWNEAEVMASDRSYWRQAAEQCVLQQHGRN